MRNVVMDVITFPEYGLSIVLHGVNLLSDAMSFDKANSSFIVSPQVFTFSTMIPIVYQKYVYDLGIHGLGKIFSKSVLQLVT